jgi:hypothetical protein
LCLIDGAKLHKKTMPSGKSVNNPTFRQLSVFSILFSVKSPSESPPAHRPLLSRIYNPTEQRSLALVALRPTGRHLVVRHHRLVLLLDDDFVVVHWQLLSFLLVDSKFICTFAA